MSREADVPLEGLIEQATRRLAADENGRQEAARPMAGLLLLRQERTSPLEASLYEPVLCLILRGRKEVSIGAQSLSFGPGQCLLVSCDLPVRSRITKAPYLALVFALDVATVRRLYDEVAESALDNERARGAATQLRTQDSSTPCADTWRSPTRLPTRRCWGR